MMKNWSRRFLTKEEEKRTLKKEACDGEIAFQKLRELALSKKTPLPEFRDLGESEKSTASKKQFCIECRFLGISAVGTASEKRTAKLKAAQAVLEIINANSTEDKPAKATHRKNKKAPTPSCKSK